VGARKPEPGLQVLDGDRALFEVNVMNNDTKSLGDAAAQPKKQPDKELIPQIFG